MTEKYTEAKYRHEYKYVCDAMQNAVLKTRARAILKRDEHVGFDGFYRIRSLYFDDLEDRCYYENEGGIGERDKYRIRIYNGNIRGYDRLFKAALDGNAHEEYASKGHCRICPLSFCGEEWKCAHHL